MKVYVVIQDGVYRHDIFGVRLDLEEAKKLAMDSLKAEEDHYHDAQIVECDTTSSGEKILMILRRQDTYAGGSKWDYSVTPVVLSEILSSEYKWVAP
jgi:hypothetical protein